MSMLHRKGKKGRYQVISEISMTSLMDLSFLLLVTFIITMPAIEQGISVRLPQGKADVLPQKKTNTITVDAEGKTFFNNQPISQDELERTLGNLAAEDPETAVLVRGDERLDYGKIASIMKMLYKVKITKMALVTLAD